MELGLHICRFGDRVPASGFSADFATLAKHAEDAGFAYITVPDHVVQTPFHGPPTDPMLEAYTTLGFIAHVTDRARLGTLVTAATYRTPGMLIKQVTTLDALSGGRAFLGLGVGWSELEAAALGLDFPSLRERFERLEDLLRIAKHMWSTSLEPFEGRHHRLLAPICSPASVQQPHPPILVAGGGGRRTLRLVAQYADACNIVGGAEVVEKLEILKKHCDDVGRDYSQIDKTTLTAFDTTSRSALLKTLSAFHERGFDVVHGITLREGDRHAIDLIGDVASEVAEWQRQP